MKIILLILVLILTTLFTNNCTEPNPDYVQFRLVNRNESSDATFFKMETSEDSIKLESKILLNLDDIDNISSIKQLDNDLFMIVAHFTPAGTKNLSRITGSYVGREVCIIVNDKIVNKVQIMTKINNGQVALMRNLSMEEATKITDKINSVF